MWSAIFIWSAYFRSAVALAVCDVVMTAELSFLKVLNCLTVILTRTLSLPSDTFCYDCWFRTFNDSK